MLCDVCKQTGLFCFVFRNLICSDPWMSEMKVQETESENMNRSNDSNDSVTRPTSECLGINIIFLMCNIFPPR